MMVESSDLTASGIFLFTYGERLEKSDDWHTKKKKRVSCFSEASSDEEKHLHYANY